MSGFCFECKKGFLDIQRHSEEVHSVRKYSLRCTSCYKKFKTTSRLIAHTQRVHNQNVVGASSPGKSDGIVCMAPNFRRTTRFPERLWRCPARVDPTPETPQPEEQPHARSSDNVPPMAEGDKGIEIPASQNVIDGQ